MKNINDLPENQLKAILLDRKKKEVHWYALFVQGNHEKNIAEKLNEREKENMSRPEPFRKPAVIERAYVPTKQVKRKWSDRTKIIDQVITTGLVFIQMRLENQKDIYIDPYIKHFLYDRDSRTPAIIPDEQMDSFIKLVGGVEDISVGNPELGDKVRILRGPYEGMTGLLIRKDKGCRFQLRLCHNLAFQFNINSEDVAKVVADAEDIVPDERYR